LASLELDLPRLVREAQQLNKMAVGRLISLFEDDREGTAELRSQALRLLDTNTDAGVRRGRILGLTGTPGSGKSSLLSRITVDLLERNAEISIAVLAIDPSSQVSGGALLGDRTRMRFLPAENRLFFRSQASQTDLGGLGPSSFQVCRLLSRLFDCVMIETVGIGQSEADIRHLADRVYLVLQPLGGDEVQFLKAGIIEIPHAFILNKSDEPTALTSYHHLRSSMWLARPFESEDLPIFQTSALTGAGLEELESEMLQRIQSGGTAGLEKREPYFFDRWVQQQWGRVGSRFLVEQLGGAATYIAQTGGYEAAQADFASVYR
jgi:LAO/AO transport system kinase